MEVNADYPMAEEELQLVMQPVPPQNGVEPQPPPLYACYLLLWVAGTIMCRWCVKAQNRIFTIKHVHRPADIVTRCGHCDVIIERSRITPACFDPGIEGMLYGGRVFGYLMAQMRGILPKTDDEQSDADDGYKSDEGFRF